MQPSLPLSPLLLRATYKMLDLTLPFVRWNLPDADDVVFHVVRDPAVRGLYWRVVTRHHIAISRANVGRTFGLVRTMAHEMIHVHERHADFKITGEHGAAFKRLALQVCRYHGFDPKEF